MNSHEDVDEDKNGEKPRLRLVNGMSLVILTLTTLWALWLVSPTKSMLVQQISRSSSPEVSMAFLNALHTRYPNDQEVILLLLVC